MNYIVGLLTIAVAYLLVMDFLPENKTDGYIFETVTTMGSDLRYLEKYDRYTYKQIETLVSLLDDKDKCRYYSEVASNGGFINSDGLIELSGEGCERYLEKEPERY